MVKLDSLPPVLTKDEKKQIYENWTEESQNILAKRNMRLAIKIALSFKNTGIEDEELVCIAMLGLVKAARRFNPALGNEFVTFATRVITNEILINIRRNRKNKNITVSLNAPIEGKDESFSEYGEIIADTFNLEEHVVLADLNRIIQDALSKESERNRKIFIAFMNGKKQEEIAKLHGLTQSYVSRLTKDFKRKIMKEWRG